MPPINCDTRLQKSAGLLGLLILLKNTAAPVPDEDLTPQAWDLHEPDERTRLEQLLSGPVYKAYGSKLDMLTDWPYFCLSELRDLDAWSSVEELLEQCKADRMIEWEVVAFGRRSS